MAGLSFGYDHKNLPILVLKISPRDRMVDGVVGSYCHGENSKEGNTFRVRTADKVMLPDWTPSGPSPECSAP